MFNMNLQKTFGILQYLLTMTMLKISTMSMLVCSVNAGDILDNFLDKLDGDLKNWASFADNDSIPEITINCVNEYTQEYDQQISSLSQINDKKKLDDPITMISVCYSNNDKTNLEQRILTSVLRYFITKEKSITTRNLNVRVHTIRRKHLGDYIFAKHFSSGRMLGRYILSLDLLDKVISSIESNIEEYLLATLHDTALEELIKASSEGNFLDCDFISEIAKLENQIIHITCKKYDDQEFKDELKKIFYDLLPYCIGNADLCSKIYKWKLSHHKHINLPIDNDSSKTDTRELLEKTRSSLIFEIIYSRYRLLISNDIGIQKKNLTALGIELSKKQKRGKNLKIIWKDPSNFKKFAKSHLRGFKNYNVCLIGSHSEIMKHKNWREGSKREAEVDFLKDLKHKISTNIFIDGKVEKNDIVFLKKIISVSLMFDEHIIGSLSIFSDTKKKGVESAVLEDKCSAKKNYVDSKTQTYPTHKSIITIDRNNTESLKKNIADRLDLIYSKVCKKISVISITLQSEIKNIYMICYKEGKDREQVDIITNIPNLGLISNAYQIIKSDEVIPGFRHIKNIRKPFLEELSTYLQITQILTYPYEIYLDDSFDLSKYDVDLQVDFSVPVKVATISYDISTKLRDSLEDTFKSFGETATILSISLNNFEVLFTEEYFSSCNKKITDFCKASKIELEYIKTLLLNQTFKGKNLFNYNELDIGNFDDDNKNLRIHAIVREDKSTILCILKPVYEDFEDYYEDYFSGLFDNIFIMRDDDLKKADINEAEEEYLQFINSFASYRRALNFKDLNSAEIYNQMFSEHIEQNLLLKATNAEYPDMNNGYKVSVIDSRTTPPHRSHETERKGLTEEKKIATPLSLESLAMRKCLKEYYMTVKDSIDKLHQNSTTVRRFAVYIVSPENPGNHDLQLINEIIKKVETL